MAWRSERAHTVAPAKINLHLEILGKRPDGFHDLVSIFIMTSLSDEIEIRTEKRGAGFRLSGKFSCPVDQNLITKAVNAFCIKAGIPVDFSVRVKKRIPEGAGLGGGSSDAAAILRLLSGLFPDRLPEKELFLIAASLGSDVLFFLTYAAAIVEGRGDRITQMASRADFAILLCVPEFSVSTKQAYSWLDNARENTIQEKSAGIVKSVKKAGIKVPVVDPKQDFWEKNPGQWQFFNSFYPVMQERFMEYMLIEEEMKKAGACFSTLSGSGSAFAGIFSGRKEAQKAKNALSRLLWFCKVISPITRLPKIHLW
ncbi:MAG: 4-(cytidine 5'-diphospho)-2-C-methyl-D-erythritol kinase [Spirochaetaceae bacterium]|nr:MAG: 4-(cytidine 5'-diphospho)-2-C-methyl-D-erythritol kinase [Spirochaetaceae bacterium]